jgi:hypothetical protein
MNEASAKIMDKLAAHDEPGALDSLLGHYADPITPRPASHAVRLNVRMPPHRFSRNQINKGLVHVGHSLRSLSKWPD